MNAKLIKGLSIGVSILGAGLGVVGGILDKKQITADLAGSKEVKDMINEAVAEALKNVK